MVDYIVTDEGGRFIMTGDVVTSSKTTTGVFGGVTRGVEYNGTAKVLVNGYEYYAPAWGLTVETIAEEPEEEEEEEDYLGYWHEYDPFYNGEDDSDLIHEYDEYC